MSVRLRERFSPGVLFGFMMLVAGLFFFFPFMAVFWVLERVGVRFED